MDKIRKRKSQIPVRIKKLLPIPHIKGAFNGDASTKKIREKYSGKIPVLQSLHLSSKLLLIRRQSFSAPLVPKISSKFNELLPARFRGSNEELPYSPFIASPVPSRSSTPGAYALKKKRNSHDLVKSYQNALPLIESPSPIMRPKTAAHTIGSRQRVRSRLGGTHHGTRYSPNDFNRLGNYNKLPLLRTGTPFPSADSRPGSRLSPSFKNSERNTCLPHISGSVNGTLSETHTYLRPPSQASRKFAAAALKLQPPKTERNQKRQMLNQRRYGSAMQQRRSNAGKQERILTPCPPQLPKPEKATYTRARIKSAFPARNLQKTTTVVKEKEVPTDEDKDGSADDSNWLITLDELGCIAVINKDDSPTSSSPDGIDALTLDDLTCVIQKYPELTVEDIRIPKPFPVTWIIEMGKPGGYKARQKKATRLFQKLDEQRKLFLLQLKMARKSKMVSSTYKKARRFDQRQKKLKRDVMLLVAKMKNDVHQLNGETEVDEHQPMGDDTPMADDTEGIACQAREIVNDQLDENIIEPKDSNNELEDNNVDEATELKDDDGYCGYVSDFEEDSEDDASVDDTQIVDTHDSGELEPVVDSGFVAAEPDKHKLVRAEADEERDIKEKDDDEVMKVKVADECEFNGGEEAFKSENASDKELVSDNDVSDKGDMTDEEFVADADMGFEDADNNGGISVIEDNKIMYLGCEDVNEANGDDEIQEMSQADQLESMAAHTDEERESEGDREEVAGEDDAEENEYVYESDFESIEDDDEEHSNSESEEDGGKERSDDSDSDDEY